MAGTLAGARGRPPRMQVASPITTHSYGSSLALGLGRYIDTR